MKQTKTLAQVANDIENGNNLHEYYNNDGATIKAGNFESFGDFLSYYRQHYRPLLEAIRNGDSLDEKQRHTLNFMADDLIKLFWDEEDSDESEDDGDTVAVVVLNFSDTENFKRAQRFFDSDGPSQFWAGDWDENARTIEFAEGNDPDALGAALCQEMDAEGITGYTWQAETQRVD
jgi:hypothetical protein